MNRAKPVRGVVWYLGTIQYCVCLFAGGAAWLLAALRTAFFWDDLASQFVACLLLLLLIAAESWWAHIPAAGNQADGFGADLLNSAGIALFGMMVVFAILVWLPS